LRKGRKGFCPCILYFTAFSALYFLAHFAVKWIKKLILNSFLEKEIRLRDNKERQYTCLPGFLNFKPNLNKMTRVRFGEYNFRLEENGGRKYIFDIARKKLVALTPEEWVRQHILHYLIHDKKYALNHIAVERGLELNGLQKRFDIMVFGDSGKPAMIIECKGHEEVLNEKVFEQIARYNLALKVAYLWVTNGERNYCSSLKGGIRLLDEIPSYEMVRADN
jgi:hypothetical protein